MRYGRRGPIWHVVGQDDAAICGQFFGRALTTVVDELPPLWKPCEKCFFPGVKALKYWARLQFVNAVNQGALSRPALCEGCGAECRPEGHHDDYTEPLQVRWLCRRCHVQFHAFHVSVGTTYVAGTDLYEASA